MSDSGLQLGAISGQVMVYSERRQLEMARDTLQRARNRTHSEREKRGYHLMWGLVEWLSGREQNGNEILERLVSHYRKARNLPGLTASLSLRSYLLLTHRGLDDDEHIDTLEGFMELVARYDLFDVVTTAKKKGDGWVIDGEKFVVLNGENADTLRKCPGLRSARTSAPCPPME